MARARELLAGVVIVAGASLMIVGEQLCTWAAQRPMGDEALLTAVAVGDVKAARRAIARGASLEAQSIFGQTPLSLAAGGGNEMLVAFLIGHGAEIDGFTGHGCTALAYAAVMSGDLASLQVLLDAGANVDGARGDAQPRVRPLVSAVAHGNEPAVALLLKRGADPDLCGHGANGWSPLTAAVSSDEPKPSIIRRLIAAGADVNLPDADGLTPLRAAVQGGHLEIATLLRQAGAVG